MQEKDQFKESKTTLAMDLFSQAISEEDPEKRFIHIKNACKIISMALPYKKLMRELYLQKDLFFYLMILEIFNKKTIALMIETFFSKLKDLNDFVELFYYAFAEIAQCPESQLRKEGKEVKLEIPPFLIKYVDPSYKRNLNRDILKYMKYIKEIAVEYLRKFTLENYEAIIPYNDRMDILGIIINFVNNTQIEGLTIKICNILRELFNHEKAHVLIKDHKVAAEMLQAVQASENTVRRVLAKMEGKTAGKKHFKLNSLSPEKKDRVQTTSESSPKLFLRSDSPSSDILGQVIKEENENEDDEDSVLDQSILNTQEMQESLNQKEIFEQWLVNSENGSVLEDESVLHFFRDHRNSRMFFSMIFEPLDVECTDTYYNLYEPIVDKIGQLKFQLIGNYFRSMRVNDTPRSQKQDKFENILIFRAYRCCQILLDEYNWLHITLSLPPLISEFFTKLYQALQLPFPKINIYVIMEVIEMFIRRDPDQFIMNLMQFNVLFVFLYHIDYEKVNNFLLKLINLPLNHYKLNQNHLIKLAKYLKYTDFFIDYLSLILDKNYKFDHRKMEISFRPQELEKNQDDYDKMITHLLNRANQVKRLPKICAIEIGSELNVKSDHDKLPEENLGLELDIDGIMKYINYDPLSSISKNLSSSQVDQQRLTIQFQPSPREKDPHVEKSNPITSSRSARMYPSLLESIRREEENRAKEKNNTSSTVKGTPSARLALRRENSGVRLSSRESHRSYKQSHSPEARVQTNTSISEISSPSPARNGSINSINLDKNDSSRRESLNRFKKKSKDTSAPQFNLDQLKAIHPDVKIHIFINHFKNVNAPLTQAVLNVSALPSRALGRTASLPHLVNLVKNSSKVEFGALPQEKCLSPKTAQSNEVQAYPLAVVLEEMIEMYFINSKHSNLSTKIGVDNLSYLKIIQCLQGNQGVTFFSLLLKNYLFKTSISVNQEESSSIACGKIVNNILFHLNEHPSLKSLTSVIHEECQKNVPYLCKIIAESIGWKVTNKPRVFLQNYVVHEVFGSHRLLLLTTLFYIIQNDKQSGYIILSKIPEILWHALCYWFVELKHQNILQNLALKIFKIVFQFGSEDVIVRILGKGNLVSQLYIAYQDITQTQNNKECVKMLHTESFLYSLKSFTMELHQTLKSRDNIQKIATFLSQLESWKALKNALLPPEERFNVTRSTSLSFNKNKLPHLDKRRKSQVYKTSRSGSIKDIITGPEAHEIGSLPTNNAKPAEKITREIPKLSILKRISEKREPKITTEDSSREKIRNTSREGSKVAFVSKNKELIPTNKVENSKTIVLPSVMKANLNHVRSQTTLKTRKESRAMI